MLKIISDLLPVELWGIDNNALSAAFLIFLVVSSTYLLMFLVGVLLGHIVRKIKFRRFARIENILGENKIPRRLAALVPPTVFLFVIPVLFPAEDVGDTVFVATGKLIYLYLFAAIWYFLIGVIDVFNDLISVHTEKYVRGFVQMLKLVVSVIVATLVVSMFMGKSPVKILAGLGASAAVLMFVFKDAILGFVASVQLSANDMLRCGDWISMPKYGADGVVFDIGLTVVKIKNWDNTVVNVPTYALVGDSYQNWRGMRESGGRRVLRTLLLDVHTIRFCGDSELEEYAKIPALAEYVKARAEKPHPYSRTTNAALFRAYLEDFMENSSDVIGSMVHFARYLKSDENGLALELYFFATPDWIDYEHVQSEITEFAVASAPEFGLRIFQAESDLSEQSPPVAAAPTPPIPPPQP